jgi:hypothetical protein
MPQRLIRSALAALLVALSVPRSVEGLETEGGAAGGPVSAVTSAGRLDQTVLAFALSTARCAQQTIPVANRRLLTLIDYSRPSTTPRLWVIDTETGRVLFEELVAHGRGSGENLTDHFSNEPGSLASSLGLFLTGDTYVGSNGYSLRLHGLEEGVNDRAVERAIVMHGAAYVRTGMGSLGRLGRSWGCPAVRPAIAHQLIDTIKGGTLLLAYYPDPQWLHTSRFIGACGADPLRARPSKFAPTPHTCRNRWAARSSVTSCFAKQNRNTGGASLRYRNADVGIDATPRSRSRCMAMSRSPTSPTAV